MALPFRIDAKNALPLSRFALQEAGRFLWDRLRGAPPRVEQALAFARAHARGSDPESVLAALDRFGRERSFLMNVGDRKGEILDAEVRRLRPARALEIGAYCGYSAVRIARLLREWGGRLVSLEASAENARVSRAMVELAGLAALVEVRNAKAEEAIPSLGAPFDLVFLDHWKDLYLPDLLRLEQHALLRPGSVVVADNVGLFDASAYFAHVRGSGRYDSRNIPSTVEYRDALPDAVEISVFRGVIPVRVAIVGERDPSRPNHLHTESALRHSARAVGSDLELKWFATDALLSDSALAELGACDGVWCTTGSPFRSLAGALRAIRFAREEGRPFLGTCSGFQHAILEYARNVFGIRDAAHAEYEGSPADALIAALACSLAGQWFEVEMQRGSRAAACYGATRAREEFFCSYGINPDWQCELLARGLPIVGTDGIGTPRILELPHHPFFIATLFVPQARSAEDAPHPLVSGFVRAAASQSLRS